MDEAEFRKRKRVPPKGPTSKLKRSALAEEVWDNDWKCINIKQEWSDDDCTVKKAMKSKRTFQIYFGHFYSIIISHEIVA